MRKALLLFIPAIFLILFVNSKSIALTAQDKNYLQLFLRDWHLNVSQEQVHKDFNSELNFISTVHDSVIAEIKHQEIAHQFFGDVSFYYKQRKGYCYDRSVLMEKFLAYYHFPFRHVYVYFGDNNRGPGIFGIFKRKLASHALTEVKTSKG